MVRVLQIFTILNRGGAETNIMNYYRHLDRSAVHFDFLVHRPETGAYEAEIRSLGGEIFRLPPINPFKIHSYKAAVKKFFDQYSDYDIIHGQNSELGVYIYEEAKRRGIPVIIAHAHSSTMSLDIKSIFRYLWKLKLRKHVTTYFTCGSAAATYLFGEKLSKKSIQINNAVDCERLAYNRFTREHFRNKLGVGVRNILHVGSFNKIKNHRFLIEIWSALIKIAPESKLFLVGDGVLKLGIVKLVKQLNLDTSIIFLGSRNDVPDILMAMDVFILPSLYEGVPVSLVEAQASGIHCVISDGIPSEAVLVNQNVTIVSLGESASSWAEKIVQLDLSNRNDVSEIIKAKGYDIKENAIRLQNKYIELLEKNT